MSSLTIAIPTYNRADYLDKLLYSIFSQLNSIVESERSCLHVIVSDNNSSDCTASVVNRYQDLFPCFKYIRNKTNLGWAKNFAQCVEVATTKYLWLIGDDDLLTPSSLAHVFRIIRTKSFGVLMVRPYGYNIDASIEHPTYCSSKLIEYSSSNKYILKTSRYFTLTSCIILNISAISHVSPYEYVETDLATFHLYLRCALASESNLFLDRFTIASKRNNSSGYRFADVFVDQFFLIFADHIRYGLHLETLESLRKKRIFTYYPFYVTELRVSAPPAELNCARKSFDRHFNDLLIYRVWLKPLLYLPAPLAYSYGIIITLIGRFRLSMVSTAFSLAPYYLKNLKNITWCQK